MEFRRFHHLGEEWEAFRSAATSAAFGVLAEPVARVGFRSVTRPERGELRTNHLWERVFALSDADLGRMLEGALTIAAIDRSPYTWRTAQGIAQDVGIDPAAVQKYLEESSDVDVLESEDPEGRGRVLYSTQDRFVRSLSGNRSVTSES
jgi:hypothetical protein